MIYILKLEHDKYYVGATSNLDKRLKDHMNGNGSEWTKRYKMKSLYKLIHNCNTFDEDKYTKQYMNKFGINNVRGGSYSTFNLSKDQKKLLIKELRTANNECFTCGRNTHYSNKCYSKTDVDDNQIKDYKKSKEIKKDRNKDRNKHVKYLFNENEYIEENNDLFEENKNIKREIKEKIKDNKNDKTQYIEDTEIINDFYTNLNQNCNSFEEKTQDIKCFICGRNNHLISSCYAKTDISDKELINENKLLKNKKDIYIPNEDNIKQGFNSIIRGVSNIYNWALGK